MQAARGTPLSRAAAPGQPDPDQSAAPAGSAPGSTAPGGTAPGSGQPGSPAPRNFAPRRVGVLLGVAAVVLALDITSKVIVVATLSNRAPIVMLGGFLTLRVDRNPGAAFSLGGPSVTVLFTAIAVGVSIFVLRTSRRIRSLPWAVTLGLLLGGALGNLTDRLFRYPGPFRGWVVDWIQWPHWPVFNLADSSIVCGGILAVLLAARGLGIDGTKAAYGTAAPAADSQAGSSQPDRHGQPDRHSQPERPAGGGGV
jgi:signal peptidase II